MASADTNLCYLTIGEASGLIRRGELSPVELTRAFLDRIEAVDGRLHAFITVLADEALEEARAAEAEILKGEYRGALHGIPLAHKDLYDTAGVRTTSGSRVDEHRVPPEDSTVIARYREAGSVLLGKLSMHEFALGGPDFTTPFQPARNPWNLEHIPGGSSSGSGAAVAAGLCMGALGSCTGGSIRGPAFLCGTVGMKATYGRVSRAGVVTLSWSQDHCGPLTWTVEDTAHMLQAIAGHDPRDPTSSRAPVPDYSLSLREDVRGLVVGVPRDFFFSPHPAVSGEVQSIVEKVLVDLEGLGASLVEVSIPSLEYERGVNSVIMLSEAFAFHEKNLQTRAHDFGEMVRARFRLGGLLNASDYVQAQRVRQVIKRETAEVMKGVDVLVTPTMTQPAARMDVYDPASTMHGPSFTAPFNITGLPAMSVPAGFTADGLPVGMQVVGKPFDEPTVLRVGHTYERHVRWYERRPPI
ncbi:MAG: hypothetical protein J4F43_02335 [Dehalococcoidia bacterium]|nr:hypothetical protein [Dehalococcoidia bacterium]